jgi:large subunit ribosomal protein L10
VVSEQMTGPLIYGFSVDAVAAARVVANFAKTNDKLVIRGGATSGRALDVNAVKMLASVPSKEVLLSQLCGLLMSPMSRTAVVLGALLAQKEAAGGATAVAAAPVAEAAPAEVATAEAAPAAETPAADAPAA